jgi:hypothetical protein
VAEQEPPPQFGTYGHSSRLRVGAVLAIAAAAGLGAWAVIANRDSGAPSASPGPPAATTTGTPAATTATARPIAPVGLSANGLRTLTASISQPIYWVGPKPGYLYELTRTSTGKIFVRYLPPGTPVGAKKATYLIIATYPFRGALKALKNLTTARHVAIPGGGIAIVDKTHPQSVHLAYPGIDNQVEVYDPSPARSLAIARSGTVRPVTPKPAGSTSGA